MHPIGYLTYALDRNPTGIGQYTRRLLEGLRDIGWAPLVLRSGGGISGKGVMPLPAAATLPGLLTLGQLEVAWYARVNGLRLLHDPTGTFPIWPVASKRVVTLFDAFPYVRPKTSTALEWLIYHVWLPFALPRADAVLTISECSAQDIRRYLNIPASKITITYLAADRSYRVLPPGEVDPVITRLNIPSPYILYVGSLEPRKNLLCLIEAYARLCAWRSEWKLVVVGAHKIWKSTPVGARVESLGLQDDVIFTGYVPDEDLPALYNAANLFVFPSLYEGFGLPVLEAMACGTPVVTSNISSLPEVAGDAAVLVEPTNVDEIASAMRSVLENQDLADDLRQRGLMRARQFNWERTARETVAVYESVLGEGLP